MAARTAIAVLSLLVASTASAQQPRPATGVAGKPPEASSAVPAGTPAPEPVDERIGDMDADGDGLVDLDEFDGARTKFLTLGDTDGDGEVSRAEIERIALAALVRREADAMEEAMDADGDGKVSVAEILEERKSLFDGMDSDGDGRLSASEFVAGTAPAADAPPSKP